MESWWLKYKFVTPVQVLWFTNKLMIEISKKKSVILLVNLLENQNA